MQLDAADWQTALRRQFGAEQNFELHNLGSEPVYSEFAVHNPRSRTRWRVAIRGAAPGQNFCSCPDFATNELGTCKHIEFTLAKLAARRGGKAALRRGFQPTYSEVWLDYAGARQVRFRAGSSCPPALLQQARSLFDAAAGWALPWDRLDGLQPLLRAAHEAGHDLRCYDDVWAFVAQIRDGEHRQLALAEAYAKGAADKGLGKLLKVKLYPYQAEGALFAARAGRALIGDEMGLGKTIQAIAAAELFARHFGVSRVLVVCPTSLKHQWKKEFERFTARCAQVIHGLRAARERLWREETFCRIVNYEMLAKDGDLIDAWAPELVIADEAQRIKNWNTIAARALKRIASPYAVVLTGTPLENKLEELISIVQFVDRHRLGPTWRLLDEHQQRDDAGRVIGYRGLDRIGQTLAPVMLRRRKAEVLAQLPERVDSRIFVPLTPEQRRHHDDAGEIVMRIVSRWRKTGYLSDADQKRLQCALQIMRMACNSTFLVDHETDHGHKVDELMTVLDELLDRSSASRRPSFPLCDKHLARDGGAGFCLRPDLLDQIERVTLRGVGRRDDVEGRRLESGAGCAAGVAHDRAQLGHQGREAVHGRAVVELSAGHLLQRRLRSPRRRHRIAGELGRLIDVGEHQLAPSLAHVPLDVVGQHAKQDVRAHAIGRAVVDRAYLQVHGFQ
ncbi:MAG: DEAD/DEAH box helicase [Rubrivivax sp.]